MTYELATNTEVVFYKPLAADRVEVTHLTRAGKLISRREYNRRDARAHWKGMLAMGFRE